MSFVQISISLTVDVWSDVQYLKQKKAYLLY